AVSSPDCASVRRHFKYVHVGARTVTCPHCPFATTDASHLRRHARLHTGARPYRCPHCPFTCNILENLRKHVLTTSKHPGKKMYECKFCEGEGQFATNQAKELRAHLVTRHPEQFAQPTLAASYVAGIYDAHADPKDVAHPIQLPPRWKRVKREPQGATAFLAPSGNSSEPSTSASVPVTAAPAPPVPGPSTTHVAAPEVSSLLAPKGEDGGEDAAAYLELPRAENSPEQELLSMVPQEGPSELEAVGGSELLFAGGGGGDGAHSERPAPDAHGAPADADADAALEPCYLLIFK
ncbi:Uncharacterized protein GBIM_11756, partial [Gryllus bimaculatus]